MARKGLYDGFLKPLSDKLLALFLLFLLWPLMLLVAMLQFFLYGPGNIIFIQSRPGLGAKPFRIFKFQTFKLAGPDKKPAISPLGKWLRNYSLDELPQLFNVLNGSMSLVGPRPLLTSYLPLYSIRQAQRHLVKPGITGLAQVSGRNAISWSRKFAADIYYTKNRSFALDVYIIVRTVLKLFKTSEVQHSENETMPVFTGNN
jgi:lipopolysaccharide/colanic/teichoic acid biosynthesis glycosyltransferase